MKEYSWRVDHMSIAKRLIFAAESGKIQTLGQMRDWAAHVLALNDEAQTFVLRSLSLGNLQEFVDAIRNAESMRENQSTLRM